MAKDQSRLWLGVILIVLGALFLLHESRFFYVQEETIISIVFALGGLALLNNYRQTRDNWKLILGGALLFIGFVIFNAGMGLIDDDFIGVFFLWAIALAFLSVYVKNPKIWWPIIPGGVLLTIGTMVAIEQVWWSLGDLNGVFFFVGIGATFGYLYKIRNEENKLAWAKWPAVAALALSVVVFAGETFRNAEDYIFPILLIGVGLFLIARNLKREKNGAEPPQMSDSGETQVSVSS